MKSILATTALTALLSVPAFAQDATAPDNTTGAEVGTTVTAEGNFIQSADRQNLMASDFIGKRVYAMAEEADYGDQGVAQAEAAWDDIGEVSDVILSRNGDVEGVIVDVGGFLGIGEKPVALTMDSLKLVTDSDTPGDYFVTVASSREALDQAPAFEYSDPAAEVDQAEAQDGTVTAPLEETPDEEAAMAEAGDNAADVNDGALTGETAEAEVGDAGDALNAAGDQAQEDMADAADDMEAAADNAEAEMADATDGSDLTGFQREGYSEVMVTELSSDDLTGLAVYDPNDNRVGEISEVLISSDGVVTDAVIDVGGFLGIGEKPVAISFEGISLQKQADGNDLRAYVNTTEEQLKNFPEYEDG